LHKHTLPVAAASAPDNTPSSFARFAFSGGIPASAAAGPMTVQGASNSSWQQAPATVPLPAGQGHGVRSFARGLKRNR